MNVWAGFIKARLNEDERWALAASAPYRYAVGNPPVPEGGVHWTWVVGENWTPVTPDPATDEFVEANGDEWSCNLATVEEWRSEVGNWMMRRTYAGTIEEMDPSAAGHIARHDPARVLREVEAKRQILQLHDEECCAVCLDDVQGCPTYRALASIWCGHEDYPGGRTA